MAIVADSELNFSELKAQLAESIPELCRLLNAPFEDCGHPLLNAAVNVAGLVATLHHRAKQGEAEGE